MMKTKHLQIIQRVLALLLLTPSFCVFAGDGDKITYPVVDTGQAKCYDNRHEIHAPGKGEDYYGQDAQYLGNIPAYKDNRDGTISDLVTGLMWQKSPGEKMTYSQALAAAKKCKTGGYTDWRVPTIKELYSLIRFSGVEPGPQTRNTAGMTPFINVDFFTFQYGRKEKNERVIDSQYGSSTKYNGKTMRGDATLFGVNFADGRIKGYPLMKPRNRSQENRFYFIFVRGNKKYGTNNFHDNGDGTITDQATGLIWMRVDSGYLKAGKNKDGKMDWKEALKWAENLDYAGHSDWRLPNIKELQSIVDYSRSPQATNSPAINPLFKLSKIKDKNGKDNYPFYWSSTTHKSLHGVDRAAYIAFGEALGWMRNRRTGKKTLLDVHGAGAQRSDPKSGNPADFPYGRGPQGDVIRIYNYAICVRAGKALPKRYKP